MRKRGGSRVACFFPAGERSGAERSSFISGPGLHEDFLKTRFRLKSGDKKGIQKKAAGEAKIVDGVAFPKRLGQLSDDNFARLLYTARQCSARWNINFGTELGRDSERVVEFFGECQSARKTGRKETRIEPGKRSRATPEHLKKYFQKCGFRSKAEPLGLVLVLVGPISDQLRHLRIDPSQRMRERNGLHDANVFTLADSGHAGPAVPMLVECE